MAVSAVGVLAAVTMWRGAALRAQGTRPPAIQSISICSATGGAAFFTSFAYFALQLDREGADGLVFNRFYEADIDVQDLQVTRALHLSDSSELLLRLRGIAALTPRAK